MQHLLITGCNRGLGLEFCRQFLEAGWKVTATCREPEHAKSLSELKSKYSALSIKQLFLDEPSSFDSFTSELGTQPVDLLINNAGTYGGTPQALDNCDPEQWQHTFLVNSISPILLTRAVLENLRLSKDPKVAFLTSKMGSIGDNSSGRSYLYRSSKAALNAAIKSLSIDLREDNIPVIALHPGWVRTDMGGPNGLIDATESITGLRQRIQQLSLSNSGCFVDYAGNAIPW
ncbi:MAG: SDR family oxidoreductase [Gammaproteobacteria bacterium]|nr:SDR family oxidoreductase [Gammaproteobacteria bacterium]